MIIMNVRLSRTQTDMGTLWNGGRTIDKSVPIETFKCLPPFPHSNSKTFQVISWLCCCCCCCCYYYYYCIFQFSLFFFLSQFDVKEKGKNIFCCLFFFKKKRKSRDRYIYTYFLSSFKWNAHDVVVGCAKRKITMYRTGFFFPSSVFHRSAFFSSSSSSSLETNALQFNAIKKSVMMIIKKIKFCE